MQRLQAEKRLRYFQCSAFVSLAHGVIYFCSESQQLNSLNLLNAENDSDIFI